MKLTWKMKEIHEADWKMEETHEADWKEETPSKCQIVTSYFHLSRSGDPVTCMPNCTLE